MARKNARKSPTARDSEQSPTTCPANVVTVAADQEQQIAGNSTHNDEAGPSDRPVRVYADGAGRGSASNPVLLNPVSAFCFAEPAISV
jgi:hypothetical protein